MIEWLLQPWPWWFSGILIGLTVPALFWLSGKAFGISTSLQQIGAMCVPKSQWRYFKEYDVSAGMWTLIFAVGIGLGGLLANTILSAEPVEFLPASYNSVGGILKLLFGGVLVGFGARYAGGCTSGHAITGLSNLSKTSLIATVFFFIGGVVVTWGLGWLLF